MSSAITQLVAILAKHELAAGGWPELLLFLQVTNRLVTILAKHELSAGGWPEIFQFFQITSYLEPC